VDTKHCMALYREVGYFSGQTHLDATIEAAENELYCAIIEREPTPGPKDLPQIMADTFGNLGVDIPAILSAPDVDAALSKSQADAQRTSSDSGKEDKMEALPGTLQHEPLGIVASGNSQSQPSCQSTPTVASAELHEDKQMQCMSTMGADKMGDDPMSTHGAASMSQGDPAGSVPTSSAAPALHSKELLEEDFPAPCAQPDFADLTCYEATNDDAACLPPGGTLLADDGQAEPARVEACLEACIDGLSEDRHAMAVAAAARAVLDAETTEPAEEAHSTATMSTPGDRVMPSDDDGAASNAGATDQLHTKFREDTGNNGTMLADVEQPDVSKCALDESPLCVKALAKGEPGCLAGSEGRMEGVATSPSTVAIALRSETIGGENAFNLERSGSVTDRPQVSEPSGPVATLNAGDGGEAANQSRQEAAARESARAAERKAWHLKQWQKSNAFAGDMHVFACKLLHKTTKRLKVKALSPSAPQVCSMQLSSRIML
jgi:hypothetical protein